MIDDDTRKWTEMRSVKSKVELERFLENRRTKTDARRSDPLASMVMNGGYKMFK
jgi:hypothetical protein